MLIGLDVMGGDYAPTSTIKGAILASRELLPDDKIVLIGNADKIKELLNSEKAEEKNFEIVHASQVFGMDEHPTKLFSQKPDSSIAVGFKLLKKNHIDAFCSAGNTGAMLVGAMYSVGTIPGVIRPCIASILPKESGKLGLLLDVGVNPDAKPDQLYQFAIIGSIYIQNIFNVQNPTVGLLNIGTEETKGNLLCQAAYNLMKNSQDFNFYGNIESRDLFKDKCDVVVCDGFTGNIILKLVESFFRMVVKRGFRDSFVDKLNYENYGGTPILGVNSIVVVGHGISNDIAIKNMILQCIEIKKTGIVEKIKKSFTQNLE